MRSVKIVIMVTTFRIPGNVSLTSISRPGNYVDSNNYSKITSDLPSANSLARAVLNSENPLSVVFNNLSEKYHLPVSDLPNSLSESFEVLKKISEVLSSLTDPEKSKVQLQLKDAFQNFYTQNMNLPEDVSAKTANRMAKALTLGPDALTKLEKAVNKLPKAVEFAENVLEILKSQDSNNHVVANNATLAKIARVPDRSAQVASLHTSA